MIAPLLLLAFALPARASTGIDAHFFHPAGRPSDPRGFLELASPYSARPGAWDTALLLDLSTDPVMMLERGELQPLIESLTTTSLVGGITLHERLRLDTVIPFHTIVSGPEQDGATLGDLRLIGNSRLLGGSKGLAVSLLPELRLPTGAPERYLGEPGLGLGLGSALGYRIDQLTLCANLGLSYGPRDPFLNLGGGSSLRAGAGASWSFDEDAALLAELVGSSSLGFRHAELPVEALFSGRKRIQNGLFFNGGAGTGLVGGIGSSHLRLVAGLGWASPGRKPDNDRDKDGIKDSVDRCPDEPEDLDDFADQDGCPDLDNDKDRVPDNKDKCPDEPEDSDGHQDEDGCPELDIDNDGIPDEHDGCPKEPEDLDGDRDKDGCPEGDPDRDFDGIPDASDACPDKPIYAYQDRSTSDGCPRRAIIQEDSIALAEPVLFQPGTNILNPGSDASLDAIRQILTERVEISKVAVVIVSSDNLSSAQNLALSQARGAAILNWFRSKGFDVNRLSVAPGVATRLDGPGAINNRVEFKILERRLP